METVGFVQVDVKANLDPLAKGFERGKKQSEQFEKSASGSFRNAATEAERFGDKAVSGATRAAAANKNVSASTKALTLGYGKLLGAVKSFAGAAAGAFAFGTLINEARGFNKALAEVSTLLPSVGDDMDVIGKKSRELANQYGSSAQAQVKAYYQIISAGASDAAEATELLDAANKLAVGGVTDIQTAADGLTSILNSYGMQARDATSVSDSLFVAMKAGKTTIGELAASIGKVSPLAAQTGVSLDELNAAIAALTKGGITTRESVTGLRAILAAVAKPTSEASKMAKQLGLDFSAAALQSEGFAGFLQNVVDKTGGSTEALSQLFGGVEALIPVMALAGQAGADFETILQQMAEKSGATAEAFDKVAASLDFRFSAALSKLMDIGLALGNVLLAVLVPAMEAVAAIGQAVMSVMDALGISAEDVTRALVPLTAALAVAFAPAIVAAVKAVAIAIGVGLVGAVRALTVAILANPLAALAAALAGIIEYTIGWQNALIAVKNFFISLYDVAMNVLQGIADVLRSLGITSFADGIEVWIRGDDAGEKIAKAHEVGGDKVADKIIDAHGDGAKDVSKEVTKASEKAADVMEKGVEKGGEKAADEVFKGLDQGGKKAGEEVNKEMTQAAEKGGAIFKAAGIEFTAESVKMIDAAARAAGDFLTSGANLMLKAAKAQIAATEAQAELYKAQAKEARANARLANAQAKGRGTPTAGGLSPRSAGEVTRVSLGSIDSLRRNGEIADRFAGASRADQGTAQSDGGSSRSSSQTNTGEKVDLTVLNVNDPEQMVNVMSSREGSRVLTNFVAANRDEIIALLGVN